MRTLLRIACLNLVRDRVALAMTFVLPIMFFTIFALVFGGGGAGSTERIRVGVVDEDSSDLSKRVVAALQKEAGLRVRTTGAENGGGQLTRSAAERLVRAGDIPVAIVIPSGFGNAFGQKGFGGSVSVDLLADVSDRIAPPMVQGVLQKVIVSAAPDLLMEGGLRQFEKYAGALTPQQRVAVDSWLPSLRDGASGGQGGSQVAMGVSVRLVDLMRTDERRSSMVSHFAAGIGVMYLLFLAAGAAGGALLEESEAGTLDRLLSTNIGMTDLLFGKWLFIVLTGVLQLTLMFLWGRVAFGLPLFSHIPGFLVMTIVTAAAAAALGMVLATLARTRAQLSGFSTILILTMSALGGSMFPRFLMSETMQTIGLFTFNAWALDGYLKVFWRNVPIRELWPQVAVLVTLTVVFLAGARVLARRWETA